MIPKEKIVEARSDTFVTRSIEAIEVQRSPGVTARVELISAVDGVELAVHDPRLVLVAGIEEIRVFVLFVIPLFVAITNWALEIVGPLIGVAPELLGCGVGNSLKYRLPFRDLTLGKDDADLVFQLAIGSFLGLMNEGVRAAKYRRLAGCRAIGIRSDLVVKN